MGIRIDVTTQKLLQRHAERSAYAQLLLQVGDDAAAGEVYDDEWLGRQKELVDIFLPVIQQLVRAGLITAVVQVDRCIDIDEHHPEAARFLVGGRATHTAENGNINITAPTVDFSSEIK